MNKIFEETDSVVMLNMYAEQDYSDQFLELDLKPVEELTKDQIYFLLERHDDDGMALSQSSVPCPHQCSKGAKLEKLLTEEELEGYKKYYYNKIGLDWDGCKTRT